MDMNKYYLQPPNTQTFYRRLAYLSHFFGMGKVEWWGYNRPPRIIIMFSYFILYCFRPGSFICVPSQIAYFYIHYHELEFNIKGIMFAIIPVHTYLNMCMVSVCQKSFISAMKDFMGKIHLYNHKSEDEFVLKKVIDIEVKTRRISYFVISFLMLDSMAWIICPAINSIKNRELVKNKTIQFETILFMVMPYDYEYNYVFWLFTHVMNSGLLWMGCVIILIHNCTNYAFVLQLVGHIEILKHNVATQFKDIFDQEEVKVRLVRVIKHHSFILQIHDDIQSAFGFNVTSYYCYNLLADSLMLYLIMFIEGNSVLIYVLMFIMYVGGMIVISIIMEQIKIESDGLSNIIYDLNWEDWSVSNRKILKLFLMKAQPALVFTAAFGLRTGVQPMISILKSTFSYYVMLKQSMSR